jgi:hypothetical protein
MKKKIIVTTSWDDGHPLDLRLAKLLSSYGILGTFYVALNYGAFPPMTAEQMRTLRAMGMEIGSHTRTHAVLAKLPKNRVLHELVESKRILEKISEAPMVSLPLLRFLVLSAVSRWRWWREPMVLVGNGLWVQWSIRALKHALSLGYWPLAVLSPDLRWHGRAMEGVPVLGGPEIAPHLTVRGVRVALMEEDKGRSCAATLSWLQQHFQRVVLIQECQDLPVEQVRVCNLGGVLGIEFTNSLLHWPNRFIKRTLDIVLGAVLLVLTLPLMALGGLSVKLFSPGRGLHRRKREPSPG